tara:strand:- start:42939 stop:43049 length:111 start_codon:yes stop_codon:yes gene_type:complete
MDKVGQHGHFGLKPLLVLLSGVQPPWTVLKKGGQVA